MFERLELRVMLWSVNIMDLLWTQSEKIKIAILGIVIILGAICIGFSIDDTINPTPPQYVTISKACAVGDYAESGFRYSGLKDSSVTFYEIHSGLFSSTTNEVYFPYAQGMTIQLSSSKMENVWVWKDGSLHYEITEERYFG